MERHVGFIDRDFGQVDEREIYGDMGWSFGELSDTFTEDIEDLIEASADYCFTERAVREDDTLNDDGFFAIYSVFEGDIYLDDENEPLWAGKIIRKTLREIHVCATKEQADWIEKDICFKDNNVTFKYRTN